MRQVGRLHLGSGWEDRRCSVSDPLSFSSRCELGGVGLDKLKEQQRVGVPLLSLACCQGLFVNQDCVPGDLHSSTDLGSGSGDCLAFLCCLFDDLGKQDSVLLKGRREEKSCQEVALLVDKARERRACCRM